MNTRRCCTNVRTGITTDNKQGAGKPAPFPCTCKKTGHIDKIKVSDKTHVIKAKSDGVLQKINALELGKLSLALGAGKETIDDKIDYTVGIKLNKLIGDTVKKGDVLATLYVGKKEPIVEYDKIFQIS